MKYLTRRFFSALSLAGALAVLTALNAHAVIRTVSTTPGPGEYSSLKAAIIATNAAGLNGDIIKIKVGSYSESGAPALTVDSVKIIGLGASPSDVHFSPPTAGTGSLLDFSGSVACELSNISLSEYDDGIKGSSVTSLIAFNIEVADCADDGIALSMSGGSLTNISSTGNGGDGFQLSSPSFVSATGLTATGNGGDGLNATGAIEDNVFAGDFSGNGDDGVSLSGSSVARNDVSGSVASGNTGKGIYLSSSGMDDNTIANNAVQDNGEQGIYLSNSTAVGGSSITDNCVFDNGVSPEGFDNEGNGPNVNTWSGNFFGDNPDCTVPYALGGGAGNTDATAECNAINVNGPAVHQVLTVETYSVDYDAPGCAGLTTGLAAFDFVINFDPTKFEYVSGSYVDGAAIPNQLPGQVDESMAASGKIRISGASGGDPDILTSDAMLASIELKALDLVSSSPITLSDIDFRDGNNDPLIAGGSGHSVDVEDNVAPTVNCGTLTLNNPAGDDTYSEDGAGPGPFVLMNIDAIDVADDFDLKRVYYRVDGAAWKQLDGLISGTAVTHSGAVDLSSAYVPSEGAHVLEVTARDASNNWASDTCTYNFVVDRTGPVLSSITLKDADGCAIDPEYTNDENMLADIVDDATAETMEVKIDGDPFGALEPFVASNYALATAATEVLHTVRVRATDKYGNRGNTVLDDITLDKTAPVASALVLNGGVYKTSSTSISPNTTNWGGVDAVEMNQSENAGDLVCGNGGWVAKSNPWPFTLSSGDGVKHVYVASRDLAGNISNVVGDSVELDQTAGPAPSVVVKDQSDGETDCTDSYTVNVEVTYSQADADMICLSTNGGTGGQTCVAATGSPQIIAYTMHASDRLNNADNTINVTVKDDATPANESPAGSDTIFRDGTNPSVTAVSINSGDTWSQSATVTVTVTGSADATMIRMAELCVDIPSAAWEPIDMTGGDGDASFTFPSPICGTNNVVVQLMDCSGRMSTVGCVSGVDYDGIFVDVSDPTIADFDLDAGAANTNSASVSLDLDAPADNCGIVEMRASLSSDFNGDTDPWSGYPVASFDLDQGTPNSAGDGTYTVYVQIRDGSGRVSAILSDDILLDRTDPEVSSGPLFILSPNPHAASGYTNTLTSNTLEGINGPGDVASMQIQDVVAGNVNITSGFVPYDASSFDLGTLAPASTLEIRIRLRDNANNVGPWTHATIEYAGSFGAGGSSVIPGGMASGEPGGSMLMSWPDQPNAHKYFVKYDRWGDYPTYTTPIPTAPADTSMGFPLAGPIEVPAGSNPVLFDFDDSYDPTPDIYAVSIWTVDLYGNLSSGYNSDILETNYILGDGKGAAVEFDNALSFVDEFGLLADAMFTVDGDAGFNPYMDIGPTWSGDAKDYPIPDGEVEFEDLVIFAINFGDYGAPKTLPGKLPSASTMQISATVPDMIIEPGTQIRVPINVSNPNSIKGLHLIFDYDETALRVLKVEPGSMFTNANGRTFFAVRPDDPLIDINAVSLDATFSDNEVAIIKFETITSANVTIVESELTIRDQNNDNIAVAFSNNPVNDRSTILPTTFALGQNYPNPFNPSTKIDISLPKAGAYKLEVFNTLGQKVRVFEGYSDPGIVTVEWDATESASGVYFYRLTAQSFQATRKMVLLK